MDAIASDHPKCHPPLRLRLAAAPPDCLLRARSQSTPAQQHSPHTGKRRLSGLHTPIEPTRLPAPHSVTAHCFQSRLSAPHSPRSKHWRSEFDTPAHDCSCNCSLSLDGTPATTPSPAAVGCHTGTHERIALGLAFSRSLSWRGLSRVSHSASRHLLFSIARVSRSFHLVVAPCCCCCWCWFRRRAPSRAPRSSGPCCAGQPRRPPRQPASGRSSRSIVERRERPRGTGT